MNVLARSLPEAPFLFVRHGESEANEAGVIAGWRDVALTAVGRQQAGEAARLLAPFPPEVIYSSPLRRALDTARIIAAALHRPIEIADGLRERDFGAMNGLPVSSIDDHYTLRPAGGEDWGEFSSRVWVALAMLPGEPSALVVAHAGVFRVLRERLDGVRANERPYNAGVWQVDAGTRPALRPVPPQPPPGHP